MTQASLDTDQTPPQVTSENYPTHEDGSAHTKHASIFYKGLFVV
jgi:hypothetical protein